MGLNIPTPDHLRSPGHPLGADCARSQQPVQPDVRAYSETLGALSSRSADLRLPAAPEAPRPRSPPSPDAAGLRRRQDRGSSCPDTYRVPPPKPPWAVRVGPPSGLLVGHLVVSSLAAGGREVEAAGQEVGHVIAHADDLLALAARVHPRLRRARGSDPTPGVRGRASPGARPLLAPGIARCAAARRIGLPTGRLGARLAPRVRRPAPRGASARCRQRRGPGRCSRDAHRRVLARGSRAATAAARGSRRGRRLGCTGRCLCLAEPVGQGAHRDLLLHQALDRRDVLLVRGHRDGEGLAAAPRPPGASDAVDSNPRGGSARRS